MKCAKCKSKALQGITLCPFHLMKRRLYDAERYRPKVGLPLDQPIFVPMDAKLSEELNRTRARNRYRIKHGIPLDAPLYLKGER